MREDNYGEAEKLGRRNPNMGSADCLTDQQEEIELADLSIH